MVSNDADILDQRSSHRQKYRGRLVIVGGVLIATILAILFILRSAKPALRDVELSFHVGDIEKTHQLAELVLKDDPQNGSAWYWLGRSLEQLQDFDAASDAYSQVASLIPDSWEPRQRLGFCLMKAARIENAETVFRKLLIEKPTDEAIQTELQWILFNQLRERELEAFLEAALEREPSSYRILYHLLYSSQRRPNPREAVGRLEEVQRRKPGQPHVELALGHCYWKLGNIPQARTLFQSARRIMSDDYETLLLVAEFELEQSSLDVTKDILNSLEKTQSQDDRWWWLNGSLHYREHDVQAAIKALNTAVKQRPQEIRYRQTLATWYKVIGSTMESEENHREAQSLRRADQELYVVVSRGDAEIKNAQTYERIQQLCFDAKKFRQADGWKKLAQSSAN